MPNTPDAADDDCPLCRAAADPAHRFSYADHAVVVPPPMRTDAEIHILVIPRVHCSSAARVITDGSRVVDALGGIVRDACADDDVELARIRIAVAPIHATDLTTSHAHVRITGTLA